MHPKKPSASTCNKIEQRRYRAGGEDGCRRMQNDHRQKEKTGEEKKQHHQPQKIPWLFSLTSPPFHKKLLVTTLYCEDGRTGTHCPARQSIIKELKNLHKKL